MPLIHVVNINNVYKFYSATMFSETWFLVWFLYFLRLCRAQSIATSTIIVNIIITVIFMSLLALCCVLGTSACAYFVYKLSLSIELWYLFKVRLLDVLGLYSLNNHVPFLIRPFLLKEVQNSLRPKVFWEIYKGCVTAIDYNRFLYRKVI